MPTFTESRVKVILRFAILVVGILILGFFLNRQNHSPRFDYDHRADIVVTAPDGFVLSTQIADNPTKRSIGLSNHDHLAPDEAMLFFFDQPGTHSFWMKDMAFPIDIVWLGDQGEVLYVVSNADPADYPKIYTPPVSATYVIELAAGFVEDHMIKPGDIFSWE